MREDDSPDQAADSYRTQVLLTVFERPPEVQGDTVNSAVVIAAESARLYPGMFTAPQYFGQFEEITKAKGFKVVNEPYEFPLGAKHLAREDFSKDFGKQTMLQSSLVILEKGYFVSFTFIAGTQDEIDELISALNFTTVSVAGGVSSSKPKK